MKRASPDIQPNPLKRVRLSVPEVPRPAKSWRPNLRIVIPPLSPSGVSLRENFQSQMDQSPMLMGSPVPKCKEHEWKSAERPARENITYYCTKCGDIFGFSYYGFP